MSPATVLKYRLLHNAFVSKSCRRQQYNLRRSSCEVPEFFYPILTKFGVYRRIFHEIRSVGTPLIRADARLNVTKVGIT